MVQIFKINDKRNFGHLDDTACVVVPSTEGLDGLMAKGVIEAIAFPPYSEQERKAFIRDYTELIAGLNSRFKDQFLWWATDISSKNRYVCLVPDFIQELLEIEKGLEACKDKPILIIAPSISIYGALQKLMSKRGRKLFWPRAKVKSFLRLVAGAGSSLIRLMVRAIRFYVRSLWSRVVLKEHARRCLSANKEYYVIKTFSFPDSWDKNGNYTDPFFGSLPRVLSKDKNVLILSYHWHGYREFIKRVSLEKTLAILPIDFFLKASDFLRAFYRILKFRVPVKGEVFFRGLDVSDVLRFELARTMNGVQVFQLLHYDALRQMFKTLRAETFLFTFENNPWERMCLLACRHYSPLTKRIAYHHSVVPEAALNMFVHPKEKTIVPLPDQILTTGEISKGILQSYGDYSLVPMKSACALRYDYLFQIKPNPRPKSQGKILLVLDGVEQTQQMLKFVLEQLGAQSRYRLRVRCHPALPWGLLSKKFHMDTGKHMNVEISQGPLQQDLDWSDMIIYWQSAVVLEAMSCGKPAINFKTRDILSYDPLFQSNSLKWTVTEQGSLLDIIAVIELMDEPSYQEQLSQALIYIKKYFYPESPQALEFL